MKLFIDDLSKLPFGDTGFQLSTREGDVSVREANPWDIINMMSVSDARTWQKKGIVIESADINWLVKCEELELEPESIELWAWRITLFCEYNPTGLFLQKETC